MDNQELNLYIIENLSKAQDPNDLILEICNRTGMNWPKAQALVEEVRSEHSGTIARKQAPFLTAIAFIIFFGGVGIMGYEGFTFLQISGDIMRRGQDPLNIIGWLVFAASNAPGTLGMMVLGLGMTLGSLIGMSEVWKGLLFPNKS